MGYFKHVVQDIHFYNHGTIISALFHALLSCETAENLGGS